MTTQKKGRQKKKEGRRERRKEDYTGEKLESDRGSSNAKLQKKYCRTLKGSKARTEREEGKGNGCGSWHPLGIW